MLYFDSLIPILLIPSILFPLFYYFRENYNRIKFLFYLRVLIFLVIVLILCGPEILLKNDRIHTLFLLDQSLSHHYRDKEIKEIFSTAVKEKKEDDLITIASFGGDVSMDPHNFSSAAIPPLPEVRHKTDIGRAIKAATGIMDKHCEGRIFLISDGEDTTGNYRKGIREAILNKFKINIIAMEPEKRKDIILKSFIISENANLAEPVKGYANIYSSFTEEVSLGIKINGVSDSTYSLKLRPGNRKYSIPVVFNETGLKRIEAVVYSNNDENKSNNNAFSYINIGDKKDILYVSNLMGTPVYNSLYNSGISLGVLSPELFPGSVNELKDYSAIILDNISYRMLGERNVNNIDQYVRNYGGGLFVIGGDKSFGQGFYKNTKMDDLLPVNSDLMKKSKLPGVTLVFVLDKSGSMSGKTIEIAKSALVETGRVLLDQDKVGIICFNSMAELVLAPTNFDKRKKLIDSVMKINSGGGTNFTPALKMGIKELKKIKKGVKHLILLSDGRPVSFDYKSVIREITDNKISLSTIAVGESTDDTLMRTMATLGKGRFYKSTDINDIPRIFMGEIKEFNRSYIEEGNFSPQIISYNNAVRMISKDAKFTGYVKTVPARGSEIVLSVKKDPLLAYCHRGLGKTGVFTSDSGNFWTKIMAEDENYGEFVRLMINGVLSQKNMNTGNIIFKEEDKLKLKIKTNEKIMFLNITDPDNNTERIELNSKDEYSVNTDEEGIYLFSAVNENGKIIARRGYVNPYSKEYRNFGVNWNKLREISNFTGGEILNYRNYKNHLKKEGKGGIERVDLRNYLILFLLILFILEIFIRRFGLGRKEKYREITKLETVREKVENTQPVEEGTFSIIKKNKEKRFYRIDRE